MNPRHALLAIAHTSAQFLVNDSTSGHASDKVYSKVKSKRRAQKRSRRKNR